MNVFFHLGINKWEMGSTLPCLEARIGFVDHIEAALATDDLAVGVTVFEGLNGGYYFHDKGIKQSNLRHFVNENCAHDPTNFCIDPNLKTFIMVCL